jgi:hypothetical protein
MSFGAEAAFPSWQPVHPSAPPDQSAATGVPLPSEWQLMFEQLVPAKLPPGLLESNWTSIEEFTWNDVSVTAVPVVVVSLWHFWQPKA